MWIVENFLNKNKKNWNENENEKKAGVVISIFNKIFFKDCNKRQGHFILIKG